MAGRSHIEAVDPKRLFDVVGPVEIPVTRVRKGGRKVNDEGLDRALASAKRAVPSLSSFAGEQRWSGVYLLGSRGSQGSVHYFYIGMSATDLIWEAVKNPRNQMTIQEHILDERGTPVVTFIVYRREGRKQACPEWVLQEIETFFIQQAMVSGHQLKNHQKTGSPEWAVVGLTVRAKHKKSLPAAALRKTLNLTGRPIATR